jgi:hypothetical protein
MSLIINICIFKKIKVEKEEMKERDCVCERRGSEKIYDFKNFFSNSNNNNKSKKQ